MSELIPVKALKVGGSEIQTVNARDLHKFLEVGKDFSAWIKDRIVQYEFIDGQDYVKTEELSSPDLGSAKARPQKMFEYHLGLDAAKEISMVERNEKGKEARKYFIECEKRLKNQPQYQLPQTFGEALRMLADSVEIVEVQKKALTEAAPKVAFADAVNDSSNSMDLGVFAKILGTGRTRLFEWLREQEYLMATGTKPYQKYLDNGYFVVIETTFTRGDTIQSYGKTQICGKGQLAIEKKWREG